MKRLTMTEEVIVRCAIKEYLAEAERRLPKLEAKLEAAGEEEKEALEDLVDSCRKRIRCAKSILEKVML